MASGVRRLAEAISRGDLAESFISQISAGTPEPGFWCESCQAPCAVRIPLYCVDGDGSHLVATQTACPDCGWVQPVPAEPEA